MQTVLAATVLAAVSQAASLGSQGGYGNRYQPRQAVRPEREPRVAY